MAIEAEERYWIEAGQLVATPAILDENPATIEERMHRLGHVRIVSGPLGTEIKWSTFAPCHASLFAAMEYLVSATAPVVLRYYLSGWFEEVGLDLIAARQRIEQIMQRSDRHLDKKTYIFRKLIEDANPPPLILTCWNQGAPIPEYAVDCIFHEESGQYFVERIGEKSTLARLFGTSRASFPCQSGNSYGGTVSEAYGDAITANKPIYDQVIASMPLAPMTFHWLSYHRLIFPAAQANRVSVVAEVASVDFSLI